jgi:hypothetical protein
MDKFLKEADLSEPKSVRGSDYNSVVTDFGGNTVTLFEADEHSAQCQQERVGGIGGDHISVEQPGNSDRLPSGIYGARGVWEMIWKTNQG